MGVEYRGLGFDPVPGDVDAVRAAVDRCARAAAHADTAATVTTEATTTATATTTGAGPTTGTATPADPGWHGTAADAFADRLRRAPDELSAAGESLRSAAAVLDGWAQTLAEHRRQAEQLDRAALPLRKAVEDARDEVARADAALQVAIGSAVRAALARHAAATAELDRATVELDRIVERARDLQHRHTAAAHEVAERLTEWEGQGVAGTPQADTYELFDSITRTIGAFSVTTGTIASTLFGNTSSPIVPASGAVGALVSAMAGPPDR